MNILVLLILACGIWAVTAAVMITNELKKRGIPVSYFWLRLKLFRYISQYSQITQQETGKVGALFYHYVIPLNLALVLALAVAFIK